MMTRQHSRAIGALATICAAGAAMAQPGIHWTEVGDAPDTLPGQLIGPGPGVPVLSITGTISHATDVDIYWVDIIDPTNFAATVCPLGLPGGGTAVFDTQLYLFDGTTGLGMAHNHDSYGTIFSSLGVPNFPGALPSATHPPFFGPAKVGLAITTRNIVPVDPTGSPMWDYVGTLNVMQRSPDISAGPLAGWVGAGGVIPPGTYVITIYGAVTSIPSPGALALLGLGLLAGLRRRR